MRRSLALIAISVVALALAGGAAAVRPSTPTTPAPAPPVKSWADPQIRVVTAAGILGDDPATFRPTDPLTRGELADAFGVWGKAAVTPADSSKLVTMSELDAQLVGALGLTPAARRIRIAARDAGLAPTSRLGTETVARLLGLRLNHPLGSDDLEPLPSQPATRAEAAYSLARAVSLSEAQVMWLDQLSQSFFVPELSSWQRAVLGRALRFVGYPYVWAGTSEVTQKIWRATAPGSWVTAPAVSTALASCGASTRPSRSPARRCSVTSSRGARPTR